MYVFIIIFEEVNHGKEFDSMEKIEKQSNPSDEFITMESRR